MTSSPLSIKLSHGRKHSLSVQVRFMSGVLTLMTGYPAVRDLLSGDVTGLFFPTVILASLALAYSISRADQDELLLHSNHIERKNASGRVDWKDIIAIRWPLNSDQSDIQLITERGLIEKTFSIDFSAVELPDKVVLVRYLRLYGYDLEQHRWPEFCHHDAAPLLESVNSPESSQEVFKRLTWKERFFVCGNSFIASRPFLAGLMAPLTFGLFVLPLMVSRTTAWMLASLTAISAFINIYAFWGEWLSPVTQICIGAIGAMAFVGILSPPRRLPNDHGDARYSKVASNVLAWCSLTVLILGAPLYLNLVARDMAPELPAAILLLFIGMLFSPLFYLAAVQRKLNASRRTDSIIAWNSSESFDPP